MDYQAGSEEFWFRSRLKPAEILCVFQGIQNAELGQKNRCPADQPFRDGVQLKRERGEFPIHPAVAPVSHMSASPVVMVIPRILHSGGQNLAALCTAAGQNLTAIGSSHSLTETVDLGTMTTAGLIGTLHEIHLLFFQ